MVNSDEAFWRDIGSEITGAINRSAEKLERRIGQLELEVTRLEATIQAQSTLKYLGTFKEGRTYDANSFVTYDGSVWHSNKKTTTAPGNGSACWQLAVKRGQDGKDARK